MHEIENAADWSPVALERSEERRKRSTSPSARRKFDSSRTRVAPVFSALEQHHGSDGGWVRRLLDLAATGGEHPWARQDLQVLERHHEATSGDKRKEQLLAPPVSLLRWLVTGFTPPKRGGYGDGDVGRFRRELAGKNPERIAEALAHLEGSEAPPSRAWFVFEGYTSPDVFLVTPDALVVVEGKRTEAGPTTSTTWMAGRHQMIRHLDAAWEIRGRRSVYGFFIVEAEPGSSDVPGRWQAAAEAACGDDAILSSLPHRDQSDREGIRKAMVGATTWQRIVGEFGLPGDVIS